MFKFVYKTTNIVNGRYYIGAHTTANENDGYFGSGVALQWAMAKYGKDKFVREILEHVQDDETLYLREQQHIIKHIGDPLCYNLHSGGKGGWTYVQQMGLNRGDNNAMCRADVVAKMTASLCATRAKDPKRYAEIARENGRKARAILAGTHHTAERLKNESMAQKKNWKDNYEHMRDALASTFTVTSPDGEEFTTRRLQEFCEQRNLPYVTVWRTSVLGRPCVRGRGKGWICRKV